MRTIPTAWIELADGCRLAARIWLPEDAEQHPVPAILEYLPYRLNDGTAVRDSHHFPYLAGHGYACVRVDQRGTGESDGILEDEYLPQEQSDACEVIAWIAEQPWCTGKVGMIGISWSGFNSLQVAAHRPPALEAIVTLCSTDDRYADDVHYDGGCVASDMLAVGGVDARLERLAARPGDRRRALARHVARAAARGAAVHRPRGWATSAATTTGSRARCARTSRASRRPSTRSAAGPTATRTPSRACSRGSPARARA